MFDTTYKLTLAKSYVSNWTVHDAIRELLQNAIDNGGPLDAVFYDSLTSQSNRQLVITSKNTTLSAHTLLLGVTSKDNNDNTIGQFGEGYKLALLVLIRSGYSVRIVNGDKIWVPSFEFDSKFGDFLLCITEKSSYNRNNDLQYIIDGLSEEDVSITINRCRHLQYKFDNSVLKTKYGDILLNDTGKLYVGGLYICDTKLDFGYDVLPKYISLERDRQTVGSWDLKMLVKNMWFDTDKIDKIVELLEAGCSDLEYADWSMPEIVKDACYMAFRNKYPNGIAANSQEQLETLVRQGFTNVVVVEKGNFYHGITNSKQYLSHQSSFKLEPPPEIQLQNWLRQYKSNLQGKDAKVAFKNLITKSAHWRAV